MPFTIRDLVKKFNLSITTVSRALDGYSDVSIKTRARVIHATQEMGYSSNSAVDGPMLSGISCPPAPRQQNF